MRNVSDKVSFAILAAALPAVVAVLAVLLYPARAFPDALPGHSFVITAMSSSPNRNDAAQELAEARQRAVAFLHDNGFKQESINVHQPDFEHVEGSAALNDRFSEWQGRQQVSVTAESYSLSARLSNRLERFQGKRTDLDWQYPVIPFFALLVGTGVATIVCLTFSVVSLETREADVTRAPRGMHPVIVFAQTLMFALLILCSLAAAHLVAFLTARVLIALLAIGVVSLSAWLYKTRGFWKQSAFLTNAYVGYIAALFVVVITGALIAARISPT